MYRVKSESDCAMLPRDHIDSPSADDGSSGGSPPRGGGPPLKKGPWTAAEDAVLVEYVKKHGEGNWNSVQKNTGLFRCGKSCRLRWANHLRPDLKKGSFTPEEEALIIKLHSKMGNKWAKMAGHLQGRTDNEIKNYWNTRIKRCQRAGIPIYPANICGQASSEDQHGSTDFSCDEKLVHGTGLYIHDFTCDNFIANPEILSYTPQLPAVSISNVLCQSFASRNYGFMDRVNQAKMLIESESSITGLNETINGVLSSVDQFSNESEKLRQAFGFDGHYETNSSGETMAPSVGAVLGSHAFLNGNFSSSWPITGASKMELPSLQDAESDPNNFYKYSMAFPTQSSELIDPYMQSPTVTSSAKSECMLPRNSGLLEELLHEAHALNSMKNQQPSARSLSSSIGTPCGAAVASPELDHCKEYWEEYPGTLFNEYGLVRSNPFNESTPPVSTETPDELHPFKISPVLSPTIGSSEQTVPKCEQGDVSPHWETFRPDALFSRNMTSPSVFNNAIAMLLENDVNTDCKAVISGTPYAAPSDGSAFDSSPWGNNPGACETSEFK